MRHIVAVTAHGKAKGMSIINTAANSALVALHHEVHSETTRIGNETVTGIAAAVTEGIGEPLSALSAGMKGMQMTPVTLEKGSTTRLEPLRRINRGAIASRVSAIKRW